MLKIEYTLDEVENEPGPNLYLQGSKSDFADLHAKIEQLALGKLKEFCISSLPSGIDKNSNTDIICRVEPGATILSQKKGEYIYMVLDLKYWSEIAKRTQHLVKEKSHYYVEFQDEALQEECNLIWSSEW